MCLYPDNVMHAVDVTVADVNPDGPEGEAILLPRAVDGDGRAQHADRRAEVSAGGRVSRRRVGREGVRGHGAGQWREAPVLLHCEEEQDDWRKPEVTGPFTYCLKRKCSGN